MFPLQSYGNSQSVTARAAWLGLLPSLNQLSLAHRTTAASRWSRVEVVSRRRASGICLLVYLLKKPLLVVILRSRNASRHHVYQISMNRRISVRSDDFLRATAYLWGIHRYSHINQLFASMLANFRPRAHKLWGHAPRVRSSQLQRLFASIASDNRFHAPTQHLQRHPD